MENNDIVEKNEGILGRPRVNQELGEIQELSQSIWDSARQFLTCFFFSSLFGFK